MGIPTVASVTGFTDQLVWLSSLPPTYIALGAVVPLLISVMTRDLMAVLVSGLFAVAIISLAATQEVNWTLFATFEATVVFPLAFAALIRQRRSRLLHDEELNELKERLKVLEAWEQRRIMATLRDTSRDFLNTTPPLTPAEDVRDSVTARSTTDRKIMPPMESDVD
jgi:hypothetical protein